MRYPALVALLCAAVSSTGCGGAVEPGAKTESAAPAVAVADHTALLLKKDLVETRLVPDHILGVAKMPGGSLGDYSVKGRKYQMFVIDAGDNQKAAFLLLDLKSTLRAPEYIAYMGGYSGSDGARDLYIFAKKQYLAGVAGLPRAEAEPLAIELASRLQ